jgi:hypothetical protein
MWTRLRGARAARRKPRAQCKKAAKECSSGEGMLLTELFSALGQPALCDCFSVFVSIRYSRLLVPVSVVRRCPEQVQSGTSVPSEASCVRSFAGGRSETAVSQRFCCVMAMGGECIGLAHRSGLVRIPIAYGFLWVALSHVGTAVRSKKLSSEFFAASPVGHLYIAAAGACAAGLAPTRLGHPWRNCCTRRWCSVHAGAFRARLQLHLFRLLLAFALICPPSSRVPAGAYSQII